MLDSGFEQFEFFTVVGCGNFKQDTMPAEKPSETHFPRRLLSVKCVLILNLMVKTAEYHFKGLKEISTNNRFGL